tara:strand:- start:1206 stop:1967 length:762 start_codon:yes stop_codon:yes gene_type:complete
MVHILDETKIQDNYNKFRKLINQTFTGERLDALNKMYDVLEDKIILTPASSIAHFHNAFAGGYIDHVLRVTYNAVRMFDLYSEVGMDISDYDKETVIFVAIHHDLGKIGDGENNWYIPNDSQWHIENQGKIYNTNADMHWMSTNDRTIYLLQHFGIKLTEVEYLSIKLTDGLYDASNEGYLCGTSVGKSLKTNLPLLMQSADMMAARYEKERWLESKKIKPTAKNVGGRPTKKQKLKNVKMPDKLDFKSIFGE